MTDIERTLRHPLWADASDGDVAEFLRVSPARVRLARERLQQDRDFGAILARAETLAAHLDWPGTPAELVARCVEIVHRRSALSRYRHPRFEALRVALREARREAELDALAPEEPARVG